MKHAALLCLLAAAGCTHAPAPEAVTPPATTGSEFSSSTAVAAAPVVAPPPPPPAPRAPSVPEVEGRVVGDLVGTARFNVFERVERSMYGGPDYHTGSGFARVAGTLDLHNTLAWPVRSVEIQLTLMGSEITSGTPARVTEPAMHRTQRIPLPRPLAPGATTRVSFLVNIQASVGEYGMDNDRLRRVRSVDIQVWRAFLEQRAVRLTPGSASDAGPQVQLAGPARVTTEVYVSNADGSASTPTILRSTLDGSLRVRVHNATGSPVARINMLGSRHGRRFYLTENPVALTPPLPDGQSRTITFRSVGTPMLSSRDDAFAATEALDLDAEVPPP